MATLAMLFFRRIARCTYRRRQSASLRAVTPDKVDWITWSAPLDRVDLVAVNRPRLGGKEPSDDYYRL
jgi:hypothetical protein